jgi:hypothetical protein
MTQPLYIYIIMKFIPWHNTRSLLNGVDGLIRMYNSLPIDSPLRLFLDQHCAHLMKPLEGNTGIPVNYGDSAVLNTLPNAVKLKPAHDPEQFNNLEGQVGVYVFFLFGCVKPIQCGSSIRFTDRMPTHYHHDAKGELFFKDYPISTLHWVAIKYCDDYVSMYSANNVMTSGEEDILVSFMQQEIRSLEQAYSSFVQPVAYKGTEVNTWHSNWVEGTVFNLGGAKRVTWVTEDGAVHTRRSLMAAEEALGLDRKTIRQAASVKGKSLLATNYGPVVVSVDGIIKRDTALDKRYNTPLNTMVDLTELKPNYYYLYDRDMNPLEYGPFASVKEVNHALGFAPEYNGVYLWCNYLHLINVEKFNTSVFAVKRSKDTSMPIVATSATGDVDPIEFASLGVAAKALGMSHHSNVVSYAVTGKLYTTKDGKSYYLSYKHQDHYLLGKSQYAKRLAQLKKRDRSSKGKSSL